jgi:hypothetical protein
MLRALRDGSCKWLTGSVEIKALLWFAIVSAPIFVFGFLVAFVTALYLQAHRAKRVLLAGVIGLPAGLVAVALAACGCDYISGQWAQFLLVILAFGAFALDVCILLLLYGHLRRRTL